MRAGDSMKTFGNDCLEAMICHLLTSQYCAGGCMIDVSKIAKQASDFAGKFGVDALVFTIAGVGVFGAFFAKQPAGWVFAALAVYLGAFMGNKLLNAYLSERQEDRELRRIRLERGEDLLVRHQDRQIRLPLEEVRRDD